MGGIVPFAIGSDKAGLNHVNHVFEVSEGIAQVFQMVLYLSGRGFHGPLGRVPVVVAKTDNRLLPPGTNVREHGTDIIDTRLGDVVGIHKVEEIEKRQDQAVLGIRIFQAAGGRRDFLRLQFIQFRMLRIGRTLMILELHHLVQAPFGIGQHLIGRGIMLVHVHTARERLPGSGQGNGIEVVSGRNLAQGDGSASAAGIAVRAIVVGPVIQFDADVHGPAAAQGGGGGVGAGNPDLIQPGGGTHGRGRTIRIGGLPIIIGRRVIMYGPRLMAKLGTPISGVQIHPVGIFVVGLHLARIHIQQQIEVVVIGRGFQGLDDRIGGGIGILRGPDAVPVDAIGRVERDLGLARGHVDGGQDRNLVFGERDGLERRMLIQDRPGLGILQPDAAAPDGPGGIRDIETHPALLHVGIVGNGLFRIRGRIGSIPHHIGRVVQVDAAPIQAEGPVHLDAGGGEHELHLGSVHLREGEFGRAGEVGKAEGIPVLAPGNHGNGRFLMSALGGTEISFGRNGILDGPGVFIDMRRAGGIQGQPGCAGTQVFGADAHPRRHRCGKGGRGAGGLRRECLPEIMGSVVAQDGNLIPGAPGEVHLAGIGRLGLAPARGLDGQDLEFLRTLGRTGRQQCRQSGPYDIYLLHGHCCIKMDSEKWDHPCPSRKHCRM